MSIYEGEGNYTFHVHDLDIIKFISLPFETKKISVHVKEIILRFFIKKKHFFAKTPHMREMADIYFFVT